MPDRQRAGSESESTSEEDGQNVSEDRLLAERVAARALEALRPALEQHAFRAAMALRGRAPHEQARFSSNAVRAGESSSRASSTRNDAPHQHQEGASSSARDFSWVAALRSRQAEYSAAPLFFHLHDPADPSTRRVRFSWTAAGHAASVALAGDFSGWEELPMLRIYCGTCADPYWELLVDLSPGAYHYLFLIDGVWKSDSTRREVVHASGKIMNLVLVDATL
ncbi:5'-AMP-activated protein kinase subunit beta-1 [Porphyridium purpureum]|uniref:5'-AMP-activated protein kinase subunit beta-1 n=1 Tax=Porphyridium purpureum TaxID=35688 RepID=A0A5J4YNI7_PORPP|nr:5'-AMP-activated protein kinase subunit beta-1 [Porphyridium purpureum]|eukprot:POR6912..scf244_11